MEFWIIGAGVFGQLAVDRLSKKYAAASIVVVDSDVQALDDVSGPVETIQRPGVQFLAENLKPGAEPDWIVPAIPVHVAFKWATVVLGEDYDIRVQAVPDEAFAQVPNPIRGRDGELYASFADFTCPDNCPEPDGKCFTTGLPRKKDLFEVFSELDVKGCTPVVIRSRQLAPGVGGFRPIALYEAKSQVLAASGAVLFCTACRCHGVVHEFICGKRHSHTVIE